MKKHILFLILIFFSLTIFNACKKDNKVAKSNTELLTQSPWKYDLAGYDPDNNGTIDFEDPAWQNCDKDDVLTFNSDGNCIFDEGATKCDAADNQTENFTWSFVNNETEITSDVLLYIGFPESSIKIMTLNETTLEFYKVTSSGGSTVTYIVRLKH